MSKPWHTSKIIFADNVRSINDERNNTNIKCYMGYDSLFPGPEELAKGRWSRPDSGGGWLTGYRRYGASKLCAVMLM